MEQDTGGETPRKHVRREHVDLQCHLRQLSLDVAADRKTVAELLRDIAYSIHWRAVNRENGGGGK